MLIEIEGAETPKWQPNYLSTCLYLPSGLPKLTYDVKQIIMRVPTSKHIGLKRGPSLSNPEGV